MSKRQAPEWWPEAWRRLQEGVPKTRVARDTGKSTATLYKHLRRQVKGEYDRQGSS